LGVNSEGRIMPELSTINKLPTKDRWVNYGLQGLSMEKFLRVVQKILKGEYSLIKLSDTCSENLMKMGGDF
jgi:hypothetical protein